MSAAPPPHQPPVPFPTPPSVEAAVSEHLHVLQRLESIELSVRSLERIGFNLVGDVGRIAGAQTVDRLTMERVEAKLNALLKHFRVNA